MLDSLRFCWKYFKPIKRKIEKSYSEGSNVERGTVNKNKRKFFHATQMPNVTRINNYIRIINEGSLDKSRRLILMDDETGSHNARKDSKTSASSNWQSIENCGLLCRWEWRLSSLYHSFQTDITILDQWLEELNAQL